MKKDKKENHKKTLNYINYAFFITMAFCLTACSDAPLALLDKMQEGISSVKESSYKAASISIDRYCDKVPLQQRQKLRYNVNAYTHKGDIFITCEGDK